MSLTKLRRASSPEWLATVLDDFDAFLLDHATCERKASATALSLLSHYPDRRELVLQMVELAREELEHFHRVLRVIYARGLVLTGDRKDVYVGALRKEIRSGSSAYFLDRLLIAGIVEARGCERFGMIADALGSGELKELYISITRSEARHRELFHKLAETYFDRLEVEQREDTLLDREAEILAGLPLRPGLH